MKSRTPFFLIIIVMGIILILVVAIGFSGKAIKDGLKTGKNVAGQATTVQGLPAESLHTQTTTTYIYGSKLIASKGTTLKYHLQDNIGSNTITTNQAGQLQSRFTSYPYGKTLTRESFAGSNEKYLFTGKERDGGLDYFGARYYNPRIGQFVSIDPIQNNQPYTYSNDNPIKYVDPNGKFPLVIVGGLIAAAPAITQYLQMTVADPTTQLDLADFQNGLSSGDYVMAGFALFGLSGPACGRAIREGASDFATVVRREFIPMLTSKNYRQQVRRISELTQEIDESVQYYTANRWTDNAIIPSSTVRTDPAAAEAFQQAQDLVKRWAAEGKTSLTIDDLTQINTVLRPGEEASELGIRGMQNWDTVGHTSGTGGIDWAYAHPQQVPGLLRNWQELTDLLMSTQDPKTAARSAGNYLGKIHAFNDANGRTADATRTFLEDVGSR
jgi:RHS repeat-associated protein